MKIKAVLFDMIGTTVHEKDSNAILNCLKLAFEENGVTANETIIKANRGKDKMEMINIILKNRNHPLTLAVPIFESFKKNINANLDNFMMAENVEKTFHTLKENKVKIGLGSGLPREQFDKIIEHLKWQKESFHYLGVSSELGKARPDPVMILDMMKSLGISNKEILKVGDTVADIEEGKNANVKTVGILSGTQHKDLLLEAKPDFLISKIDEVIEVVTTLN